MAGRCEHDGEIVNVDPCCLQCGASANEIISELRALKNYNAASAEECDACDAAERQVREIAELAAYDPRGRVKLYCGRCGEWKPSDEERTLPEHHEKTHGARLVGSFEWMHSVGYGPLDEEETAR